MAVAPLLSWPAIAAKLPAPQVIPAEIIKASPMAKLVEMPLLARKYECDACHAIDQKVLGPSFISIAMRYKGQATYVYSGTTYRLIEGLSLKVENGGSGNWGSMPMPRGNTQKIDRADVGVLVKTILEMAY